MSTPYTEQNTHSALPNTSHDELSRQHFVRSFKEHIVESLHPGLKLAYEKRARPQYVSKHQREPETIQEVGEVMKKDPHYQAWSSLLRTSQEMMWSSTQIPVERAIVDLAAQSADNTLGSLTLNPNLEIPSYHTAVDIHCQPGGYHTEYIDGDVAQGAIYDRAVYLYAMGQMGRNNADMGDSGLRPGGAHTFPGPCNPSGNAAASGLRAASTPTQVPATQAATRQHRPVG